jgi:predicted RND superfamily exporter protein
MSDKESNNKQNCIEKLGNNIESSIASFFALIGQFIGIHPRKTIAACILLAVLCGGGFAMWKTESRALKLWTPQNTIAEKEGNEYEEIFARTSRFNNIIVRSSNNNGSSKNVLVKETLVEVMKMHLEIETKEATIDDEIYKLTDVCTKSGAACSDPTFAADICQCLVSSFLKLWNYDLPTLESDDDILNTINSYSGYNRQDLESIFGKPTFDENGNLISAEAFSITYLNKDRTIEAGSDEAGTEDDPINERWEKDVFLYVLEKSVPETYKSITVDYFSGRSFSDEFGGAIQGDLLYVQVSYVIVFLFLGANLGKVVPGLGSRWTMSLAALVTVGLSIAAGFGVSSLFGLFYGPVHSLLPFILLGIGVDDGFVIVNAFNRERKVSRSSESNLELAKRTSRALARAGASITVTSLTDLVAFGISSSSSLPALASFCGYAAIGIFFLWLFAATFFSACMVLDERRQRDNRRECLCCLTRKKDIEEDEGNEEGYMSKYFRNYHAPAILTSVGKVVVIVIYAGLLGAGIYGTLNLSVEDTQRSFIPSDSYLTGYLNTIDEYYPSSGIELDIFFTGSSDDFFANKEELADLASRLTGKSTVAPYIAEPLSEEKFSNVMSAFANHLNSTGSISGIELDSYNWPKNSNDFDQELASFISFGNPGERFFADVKFNNAGDFESFRVKSEFVRLTKMKGSKVIDDADKQIAAMDGTRDMIASWDDLSGLNPTPYSEKFISIEGFKIIKAELFLNVGLALAAVAVIVLITVASPVTAFIITVNVAFCLVEILGFMYFLGIAIDSVSVINIVLAVGLSIDYSAHVGHCFMTKGGSDKNKRSLEALSDIGAAVLSGALTTFLAVAVLLFSTSYVFATLSIQFALTVGLGATHGLVLLPVLLSLFGPKAFDSAEDLESEVSPESFDSNPKDV